jgi:hypothetical protein
MSAELVLAMGVWPGVAMDSLKFHLGPPCPTLLRPAGRPPLKRPYGCFKGRAVLYPLKHPLPYVYGFGAESSPPLTSEVQSNFYRTFKISLSPNIFGFRVATPLLAYHLGGDGRPQGDATS